MSNLANALKKKAADSEAPYAVQRQFREDDWNVPAHKGQAMAASRYDKSRSDTYDPTKTIKTPVSGTASYYLKGAPLPADRSKQGVDATKYSLMQRDALANTLGNELPLSAENLALGDDVMKRMLKTKTRPESFMEAKRVKYGRHLKPGEKWEPKYDDAIRSSYKQDLDTINIYDMLRQRLTPQEARETLNMEQRGTIDNAIEKGLIFANTPQPGMGKVASAILRKAAEYNDPKVSFPQVDYSDASPGTEVKIKGTAPITDKWWGKLFEGYHKGGIKVDDAGNVVRLKGEARVAPTALGYGTAVAGGGALGGGLGAMLSENRLVGGLTGGAIGAVAAPLALLIASKQGLLDNLAKTAEEQLPATQRYRWVNGKRVENPNWKGEPAAAQNIPLSERHRGRLAGSASPMISGGRVSLAREFGVEAPKPQLNQRHTMNSGRAKMIMDALGRAPKKQ